jgi:putative membrane protein
MFQRPGPGIYEVHHGGGHPWFGLLLFALMFGALAVAVFTLWRTYPRSAPAAVGVASPVPAPPARDPALAELRLRYARGEIDRDEYLTRAVDLGDVPPPPPQSPPAGDA